MKYVELIDKINDELKSNGIKPIYFLIANDFDILDIQDFMKNTSTYKTLTDIEKKKFIKYLKTLQLQNKLMMQN